MSISRSRIHYMDTRVFADNNGKLRGKFKQENDVTPALHLNPEGTKLLASRLKAVLREGHHLPSRFRQNVGQQQNNRQSAGSNVERGSRGGHRGRGGRGGRGGTSHTTPGA